LHQRFHFALQRALIYVAENVVVDFDNRRQRALAETGHGAHGQAAIRRGDCQLVGLAVLVGFAVAQAEIEAELLQQIAGAARVTGGSAANTDHVVALGFQIEERVKRGCAIDSCGRHAGFVGNVAQRLHGEEFVRVGRLNGLKNAQQRAGAVSTFGDGLIDEQSLVGFKTVVSNFRSGTWHDPSQAGSQKHHAPNPRAVDEFSGRREVLATCSPSHGNLCAAAQKHTTGLPASLQRSSGWNFEP
jgi:hypothetical protein